MIDAFASCDPYSWQSTQVYTPFGRMAVSCNFFFGFSQVSSRFVRKDVGFVKSTNANNQRELTGVAGGARSYNHSHDRQVR
jgi:hypothetical protein